MPPKQTQNANDPIRTAHNSPRAQLAFAALDVAQAIASLLERGIAALTRFRQHRAIGQHSKKVTVKKWVAVCTLIIAGLSHSVSGQISSPTRGRQADGLLWSKVGSLSKTPGNMMSAKSVARMPAPDAVTLGLAKAKNYRFSTRDFPGAYSSQIADYANGTAVGGFSFDSTRSFSFTVQGGKYQIVNVPGSLSDGLAGINNAGQMVGVYLDSSFKTHGFLDVAGQFTTIDVPGSTFTIASDINDAGVIIGGYVDSQNLDHGFIDNAGVFTPLDYPGASVTNPSSINSAGDVVGHYDNPDAHGFLYHNGSFTSIDFPLGDETLCMGINDAGTIVGRFRSNGTLHGFIYSHGTFTQVDVEGAQGTVLTSVDQHGRVSGIFIDFTDGEHGMLGQ